MPVPGGDLVNCGCRADGGPTGENGAGSIPNGQRPSPAARLGHRDGRCHRDVQRSDPARLRDVGDRVGHREQRRRAAVVLVSDGEADVAVQRCLVQRDRSGGQFDHDHPQARGRRRLGRRDRARLLRGLDQPLRTECGLAYARVAEGGRVAAQPQLLDPERGGRADDRAHVKRLGHRVEQQGQAGVAGPAPLAVEPLDLGGAQLPGCARPGGPGRAHGRVTSARSA